MMETARHVVHQGHTSILGLTSANAGSMVIAACIAAVVFGVVGASVPPLGDKAKWWQTFAAFVIAFASADIVFFIVLIILTR